MFTLPRCYFFVLLIMLSAAFSFTVSASGITLSGTRIIYPQANKQVSLAVKNMSDTSRVLVQTWISDDGDNKRDDFIVTPPLYVSNPGDENTLRLMYVGKNLSRDKETLFYFSAKSIPAVDKDKTAGKNLLMLATVTRIKLFYRPDGLKPAIEKAQAMLKVNRLQDGLTIENPTPYYITLAKMRVNNSPLQNAMIIPYGKVHIKCKTAGGDVFYYRTINDFGGMTEEQDQIL